MPPETIHFVTGRLAEPALRATLEAVSRQAHFAYTLQVLPITVAALMSPDWIARHLQAPGGTSRVLIPGYVHGDLSSLVAKAGVPVQVGPKDLRQLPEFFGQSDPHRAEYGAYDIEILAEINHAPRLPIAEILRQAADLRAAGADRIDVGCDPGEPWSRVGDSVRALKDAGHRVSIDSLNPLEIAPAVRAGAELVLSVNATNREAAVDWGCEVVVIPDEIATLGGLDKTLEFLATRSVPHRIDPILEPIGFGFAASLKRYGEVRQKYPDAAMMMGIGNLTELTDADSAGVNTLLLAICQELGIQSVLTTQVINWARTSVAECNLARRLVYHAIRQRVLPKHLEPGLVMLRDPRLHEFGDEVLDRLAGQIKDTSYRVFAEGGQLHLLGAGLHLADRDPFLLFERLLHPGFGGATDTHAPAANLDPSHAFYLGYELCKAAIALQLGKEYQQDESLRWGLATVEEESHRVRKSGTTNAIPAAE